MSRIRITAPAILLLATLASAILACSKDHAASSRRMALGNERYAAGDLDEAVKTYQQVLAEDSDYLAAHLMLGKAYYFKHEFRKALEQMELAAKQDSSRTDVLVWLAKAQSMTPEREDEALENLGKALAQDPGNLEAHYLRGRILERKNNLAEAMKAYEASIREARKGALSAVRLGNILRKAGLNEQASKAFRQARDFASGDRPLLQELDRLEHEGAASPGKK